jgi:hypothetical protein
MGYDTIIDGHRFFVPEKFHQMQLNKNMYGTDPNFREHLTMQGNYGSYYNPETGEWHEGEFGNMSTTGDSTHGWQMGAGTWQALEGRRSFADNPQLAGWGSLIGNLGNSYADIQGNWTNRIEHAIGEDAYRNRDTTKGSSGEETTYDYSSDRDYQLNPDYGSSGTSESDSGSGQMYVMTDRAREAAADVSCFTATTLVRMADGSVKPIADVQPGDTVKSLDGDAPVIGMERVGMQGRNLFGFLKVQDVVWFTSEHPFLSERGWVALEPNGPDTKGWGNHRVNRKELNEIMQTTDKLLIEGGTFTVDGIVEQLAPEQTLYNLMLGDGNQVYYVGPSEDRMFAVKH